MSKYKPKGKPKSQGKVALRNLSPSQLRAMKRKQRFLTKTEAKNNGTSN